MLARSNATLADGAAALKATATIMDDDDAVSDPAAGDTTLATRIFGPDPEPGILPTLDVRNVNVLEGASGSETAYFLLTLDRPATALVEGSYYLQAETASENYGDYFDRAGNFSIRAGEQSTWIPVTVLSDTLNEGDESFQLVLTTLTNAVFPGNAPVATARATIRNDDGPGGAFSEGIVEFGEKLEGPAELSSILPTIRVNDINVREGNSGSEDARFLVTLDKPAPIAVTVRYEFSNISATEGLGDYDQRSGTLTIAAGQQTGVISTRVLGDNLIEGDEEFSLVLSIPTNAVFEENAVMLEARGTIIDDDGGTVSGPSGIGDPAQGVIAPDTGTGPGVRIGMPPVKWSTNWDMIIPF